MKTSTAAKFREYEQLRQQAHALVDTFDRAKLRRFLKTHKPKEIEVNNPPHSGKG